tara:strand:- start:55 stop:570 length:516 start_codon:yes stop_codon:yes gene_type:complete
MKTLLKTLTIGLTVLVLASCGGSSAKDFVGTWKADASSLNLTLGDDVPAEIKLMIEEKKKGATLHNLREADRVNFKFKEGGRLSISWDQGVETLNWSVDGDYLTLDGEIKGDRRGEPLKGKVLLYVESVSSNKLTVSVTAQEIVRLKELFPGEFNNVPNQIDRISISLNKE